VGDKAPALAAGKWIQGEPVKEFEADKAYIVEFWATWCGPCVATIPHLNELHEKFKDKGLVVIGQNVWERDEESVPAFVTKRMKGKMTYRVALDDKSADEKGAMATTWMAAAGQNGIPAAFLVGKDGKIAWIGHPAKLDDGMIESLLAGKFDAAAAAADAERAAKAGEKIRRFVVALQQKDYDEADAAIAEMEKDTDPRMAANVSRMRLAVLSGRKDFAGFHALVRKIAAEKPDDAQTQNEMAWMIAANPELEKPDLDLAAELANKALELSKGEDAAILDTAARVNFMRGDKEKALEQERKALSLAPADHTATFEATLAFYEKGELPTVQQVQAAVRDILRRKAESAKGQKDGTDI
jgi:thiol-disulfide isomerase/thioredoxin